MTRLIISMAAVSVFCLAVGIRAAIQKEYVWAVLAFACVGLVVLTPIPTHAVKLNLGTATDPQEHTSSSKRP